MRVSQKADPKSWKAYNKNGSVPWKDDPQKSTK